MPGTEVIHVDDPRRREILAQYLAEQKFKKHSTSLPDEEPRKTDRLNSVAQPTVIDNHRFPSKKEAKEYVDLKLRERIGDISHLQIQVLFPLVVNGVPIYPRGYVADFSFLEKQKDGTTWKLVIQDSKGVRTDAYIVKRQLMLAIWGIAIRET